MGTDLLVLGAGPAGAAISLLMADKGYSVEILDAAHFPRTKICGEFLNPQACKWLEQQNLLKPVEQMEPYPIHGMKITDLQRNNFRGTYANSIGYAIQRKDFDSLLVSILKRNGIQLQEGFHASELLMENGSVTGVRGKNGNGDVVEKRARVLIGADGRNNLVGRTFGWIQPVPNLRKYAYLTYFEGVEGLEPYGEIHLVRDGYVGVAPLSATLANVALVVDEKNRPQEGSDVQQFFLSHVQQTSLGARIANAAPIAPFLSAGPLAYSLKRTSGYCTLLVGDTCGFIDPFTGEGINYAFLTASIAADVLDSCFRSNRFDDEAFLVYDEKRLRLLGKKFYVSHLLQKAVHSPWLSGLLVRRFGRRQRLADQMVSAVGGAIPVDAIWNLRFLLQMIF